MVPTSTVRVVVSLAAVAAAGTAAPPAGCTSVKDVVFGFGANLREPKASSADECCDLCRESVPPSSHVHTRSAHHNPHIPHTRRREILNCSRSVRPRTHVVCVTMCARTGSDTKCAAWTFHPTAVYTCVLHTSASPVHAMPGAVSGVPHGPTPPVRDAECSSYDADSLLSRLRRFHAV